MRILITGGAGFIGCNTAKKFHEWGHEVVILDNLSRPGSRENLKWLGDDVAQLDFICADVTDAPKVAEVITRGKFNAVIHLAGQVAVTTSVVEPRHDFEVNTGGTFNMLEAVRLHSPDTAFIYSSTNKVYGGLTGLRIRALEKRYEFEDYPFGISENQPLDFHSPYGCSKGASDSYVVDYARIYGLRTMSLRQSCIYGCRQFGVEDQGWLAWFAIAHLLGRPLTLYGDGRQVRDVLFVDDLADCYRKALSVLDDHKCPGGRAFNIGGGPKNTLSLLECLEMLGELSRHRVDLSFAEMRPGDQKVYVSDIRAAATSLGWAPQTAVLDGMKRLVDWITANIDTFRNFYCNS